MEKKNDSGARRGEEKRRDRFDPRDARPARDGQGRPQRGESRDRQDRPWRPAAGYAPRRDGQERPQRREAGEDRPRREPGRAPAFGREERRGFEPSRAPRRPEAPLRSQWDGEETENEDDEAEGGLQNEIVEGRNAVIEALRAGRAIDKLYINKGETDRTLGHIASTARDKGIVVVECDRRKLDFMSRTHAHQGVIALCAVRDYCSVDDLFAIAEERGEEPFFVVCDEISDGHNLGAIIRSAECAGAHGVIIPKRRSAGLTAIVDKASAGAAEHMAVARVPNIPSLLRELKERGVWVYGTAADGETDLWHTDFSGAVALVIGSEGDGMGRLVREQCDHIVSLPMRGQVSSLNASAAAAITMYEILRQRSR